MVAMTGVYLVVIPPHCECALTVSRGQCVCVCFWDCVCVCSTTVAVTAGEWQPGLVMCSRSFEVMLAALLGSSVIRLKEAGPRLCFAGSALATCVSLCACTLSVCRPLTHSHTELGSAKHGHTPLLHSGSPEWVPDWGHRVSEEVLPMLGYGCISQLDTHNHMNEMGTNTNTLQITSHGVQYDFAHGYVFFCLQSVST